MLFKKSLCILVLFLLILGGMSFSAMAADYPTPDDPITLDLGHILSPESIEHQSMIRYKNMVEEKTGGAIKIELFPAGQLGTANDQIENIKTGIQAMHLTSTVFLQGYAPRLKLTEIPFLYKGEMETLLRWFDEVLKVKVVPKLKDKVNVDILNLGNTWLRAPYVVIASRKPVYTPEDLKNIKLRLWPSETAQKAWKALGANVSIIDYGEVYLALQYGTVDALINPVNLVYTQKFTEVANYVSELRTYPVVDLILINNDIMKKLSPEQQQILKECSDKVGNWNNEQVLNTVEPIIEKMIAEHNAAYIRVNREPFIKLTQEKVIPYLIEEGIIQKEHVEEIWSLQPEE